MPSHVGIEGNPQAELLATKGGLANPLNLIMQQNSLRGEPHGQAPRKIRKFETGHLSNQKELLSASDTAILLQSPGLEVMEVTCLCLCDVIQFATLTTRARWLSVITYYDIALVPLLLR